VAVKKEGNNVGNSTFGGFCNDRLSGNLELLVSMAIETNNGVFAEKLILGEHQQGQKVKLVFSLLPESDAAILGASALVWEKR
jgi:hypothetical protein